MKYLEKLTETFANFSLIAKITSVSSNDIGDLLETYAEGEGIMSQAKKKLISSFRLQEGTPITPLLLFYLQLGPDSKKTFR